MRCRAGKDRGARRRAELLHHGSRRSRACRCALDRHAARATRGAAAARRRAVRGEEPVRRRRPRHARRLEDQPRAAAGAARTRPWSRGWSGGRGAPRRAQHGRVRVRLHHREHALRPDAQPARPGAHRRRLLRRIGRGGRGRAGAARARHRHQRFDPRAGVVLRRVRSQADLRPAVAARGFPFAPSFDHVGLLARRPRDLAAAYDAMQGADPADPAQAPQPQPASPEIGAGGRAARRAARRLVRALLRREARVAVDAAARALRAGGTIEFPEVERARAAAFVITARKARTCTSQTCAAAPPTSTRARATASSPGARARVLGAAGAARARLVPGAGASRRFGTPIC